jgi:uncharacterized protein (TIGR03792 family)
LIVVIEWLKVRVPHEFQPKYLEVDARIWTLMLSVCPGFVRKQTWRDAQDPDALVIVIQWQTLALWKAIPADVLAQTEQRFNAEMGQSFAFQETKTFEVISE